MSALEVIAALLGVINVVLILRRQVWNYPFGLAMVVLYAKIFFDARLYADALLQAYFFGIQVYGWWNWSRGLREQGDILVETMSLRSRIVTGAATLFAAAGIGWLMITMTDAAAPWLDATVSSLSVAAQWLLSRRKIENWVLWIAVDVLGIGLFLSRGLYPTAALYAIFLVLACAGLAAWLKARRRQLGAEREA